MTVKQTITGPLLLFKWYPRVWLLIFLILGVYLWLLSFVEAKSHLATVSATEEHLVTLASEAMRSELSVMQSDVLFLAEQTTLQQFLNYGSPYSRKQLGDDFLQIAQHRELYDQIRFIDEKGQEVIRVNRRGDQPVLVPEPDLQNKRGRDYVDIGLNLQKQHIYISRFDLNVENGVIEQPIKPVIRISTPILDSKGRKRGVVVLNYLGNRLLKQFQSIREKNSGDLWLVNNTGDWLSGPIPENDWAFMRDNFGNKRFDTQFPDVWAALQSFDNRAQIKSNGEIFTGFRIAFDKTTTVHQAEQWYLVAHLSQNQIAKIATGHGRLLDMFFIGLALVLILLVVIATYFVLRKINDSENRFSNLFEFAPDAMVIANADGCITLVNAMTEKIFGYSRDELIGAAVEKLLPGQLKQKHIALRTAYVNGNPQSREMSAGVDILGMRKDGSVFPIEVALSPSKSRKGMQVTSILRDVTVRKQIERQKQLIEGRFGTLVNNLPIGVYRHTLDENGQFLDVNPAMGNILDAESEEQLLRHDIRDFLTDPNSLSEFTKKLMQQGNIHNEEVNMVTLQGREFVASITAILKQDTNGENYVDGIMEDISERKRNEQQIQRLNVNYRNRSTELETINRELESFSYSVSHDLRSPLRAIDGFSRTLLTGHADKLDEIGKDRLNRIRAAAQRMGMLIDDLLNLSRVSREQLTRDTVDLSKIVNEVAQEIVNEQPERTVQLSIQPELRTHGDSRLLRVVMSNLLRNAWKFTSRRESARIDVGERIDGNEHVYYVRDNGAGFDMRYADKLFGAFQRLHDNQEFPGTGIGLATVQRVIHKHGGRIWAESEVGKGANFYFTLEQRGNV